MFAMTWRRKTIECFLICCAEQAPSTSAPWAWAGKTLRKDQTVCMCLGKTFWSLPPPPSIEWGKRAQTGVQNTLKKNKHVVVVMVAVCSVNTINSRGKQLPTLGKGAVSKTLLNNISFSYEMFRKRSIGPTGVEVGRRRSNEYIPAEVMWYFCAVSTLNIIRFVDTVECVHVFDFYQHLQYSV